MSITRPLSLPTIVQTVIVPAPIPPNVGVQIDKSPSLPSQIIWDESSLQFKSGIQGFEQTIATINALASNGFLKWNGTQFVSTGTSFVNNLDQDVDVGSNPIFGNVVMDGFTTNSIAYNLPTSQGVAGSVLATNGSGTLSWSTSISAVGNKIVNDSNDTSVAAQGITDDHTIYHTAGNQLVQKATSSGTDILKPIIFKSGFSWKNTDVLTPTYTILIDDTMVMYKGTTNCVITLPAIASSGYSRFLTIQNLTAFTVTINPNGAETIDNTTTAIVLDESGSDVMLIGNGNSNWITV